MKNLFAILALVCGVAFMSSCSNDDESTSGQKTLIFSYNQAFYASESLLYDNSKVANELLRLLIAKVDETIGSKGGVITVNSEEEADIKAKVKQVLVVYSAELEASCKYPGTYIFDMTCDFDDLVRIRISTADEFLYTKIDCQLFESNGIGDMFPVTNLNEIRTNNLCFNQKMSFDVSPYEDYNKHYKKANVTFSCVNAYGETVYSNTLDKTDDLNTLLYSEKLDLALTSSFFVNGGQYTATFDTEFMNYKKDFHFTVLESAKTLIRYDGYGYDVVLTTGYPFTPSDFTKEFNVKVQLVKTVDGVEQEVKSLNENVTLVKDVTRTNNAAVKVLNVCQKRELEQGDYKIVVTSDWAPANNVQSSFSVKD